MQHYKPTREHRPSTFECRQKFLVEQRLREESDKQNKELEQKIRIYAVEIEASKKGRLPWQQH